MGKDGETGPGTPEIVAHRSFGQRNGGVLTVLLVVAGLLAVGPLAWTLNAEREVRIRVLDKTVPHDDYREHAGLHWALNHLRTSRSDGMRPWRPEQDYVGWYPQRRDAQAKPFGEDLTARHLADVDLLYVADTYGVYKDDLTGAEQQRTALDYSERIFGGLSTQEAEHIEAFARRGGHVVAEFNTFASPTGAPARKIMEDVLGVDWSGWTGRPFEDLSDHEQVPRWAMRDWERHHGSPWTHQGPGWILSHRDTRIQVLHHGPDVGPSGMRLELVPGSDPLVAGLPARMDYRFWFDVVAARPDSTPLAHYRFDLTDSGREKLDRYGIPSRFPAIVLASRAPLRLYLAGDFADARFDRGLYWSKARRAMMDGLGLGGRHRDQRAFFWLFYLPLLEHVLDAVRPPRDRAHQ